MFSFCNDLHKIYQEDYNKYVNIDIENNYKNNAFKCGYDSDISNLWLFKSKSLSNQNFVIVPSLFNSPKILFFNQDQNYIEYMKLLGNVYLIEWRETKNALKLSDYANDVANVLQFIEDTNSGFVNLVGHCIGGNIAIFTMFIYKHTQSLTLLTTPWDYSHFSSSYLISELFEIKKAIYGLKIIPKIYVQMMFFLLFPDQYQKKVTKYFSLDKKEEKEKYLRIEQWLQSGIDIPSSLYNEIIDDIIAKNNLVNKNFYIKDRLVSLDKINIPTCIIGAREDQIAPISSMLYLQKEIKKSKMIIIDGGHINYLVNNDQKFKKEYTKWFRTRDKNE